MALSVATNIGALAASKAANSVNKAMETSMARLSSGKRINSAADDSAGLALPLASPPKHAASTWHRETQLMLKQC